MVVKAQKSESSRRAQLIFLKKEKEDIEKELEITQQAHGHNVSSVLFRKTKWVKKKLNYAMNYAMDKFQGVTLKKILKNKVELDLNICSCLLIDQKVIKEISEISEISEIHDKGIRPSQEMTDIFSGMYIES